MHVVFTLILDWSLIKLNDEDESSVCQVFELKVINNLQRNL